MFGHKQPNQHIPAKVRAYGRARIEIAHRAQSGEDWNALWKPPQQSFPFDWGEPWKQCIEYKVDDFSAEVGFFIDVMGLPVNAFNVDYAMFTSPRHDFYFAVVQAQTGSRSTPPDALRLQFMVADIFSTTQELERRGIHLEQAPQPIYEGSQQWVASFHTPHGISLEIWGMVEMVAEQPASLQPEELESVPKSIQMLIEEEPLAQNELEESNPVDQDEIELGEPETEYNHSLPVAFPNAEPAQPVYTSPSELDTQSQPYPTAPPAQMPVVQSFQNGQAMLDHLKQKKSQRQFSSANPSTEPQTISTQAAPKPPLNTFNFRPAPKSTVDEPNDSIWSQVDKDAENVDPDEAAPDEYHYKPIPLNRKP